MPDWALIQGDDGTVGWAYGDDLADALAGGASIVGMDAIATGNYDGVWGAWSSSDSSDSGDGGGSNGPVTVTPSNPDAVISAGVSTAPALPGETKAGVGTISLSPIRAGGTSWSQYGAVESNAVEALKVVAGAVAIGVGLPLAIGGGVLTIAGIVPGLALGEVPVLLTASITVLGVSLVDWGWQQVSGMSSFLPPTFGTPWW